MAKLQLGDLNGIGKGANKRWIYKDSLKLELAHDYLQKVSYSMQDINYLLKDGSRIKKRTDILSLIVMADWIADSVWQYKNCLQPGLLDDFCFSDQEALSKSRSFIKGIRSFIIAHPLNTEKHEQFGFDGDVVCIDLRTVKPFFLDYEKDVERVGLDGVRNYGGEREYDFYLYAYSKQENAEYFKHIVIDLEEVLLAAKTYVLQLYEIDFFLSKLKMKDYAAK